MSLEKFWSLKEHAHPSASGHFSLENVYYVLGLWLPGLSNLYNVLMWESQIPTIAVQILLLISHFVSRYVNILPPLNLNDGVKLCLSICFVTTGHFASLLILLRTLSLACILVILV